jgi:cardiolipin synthase
MSLVTILLIVVALYTLASAIFIILENRSPSSTFAWLFLFVTVPIFGVLVYMFVGRSWHAFALEQRLNRQEFGTGLSEPLEPLLQQQEAIVAKISDKSSLHGKEKLLNLVRRNSSSLLTQHNDVEILQDAKMKYPRLLEDIKNAKHHIHLNYYIWTEDEFTLELKDALIEKAKAGVAVRCLYDASGGSISWAYREDLKQAGAKIDAYLEYRKLNRIHTINYRSHRKIAVIDGSIGYIGGLNLDKDQLDGGKYFDAWRDTHLRLTGEAVLALQASFITSWFNTTEERVVGPAYFPDHPVEEFVPVQITMSGPDSQWQAIRQLYFYMIMAAKERVYLQSPFFIPDESILEALKAVALAGVEVKMICTPRGTTYSIPYWAANTYFKEVAAAGVEIYLYQAGYFHAKTLSIDGQFCTIGTANMDIRSFSLNYEANAVIYDPTVTQQLERDFDEDLKHCTRWTIDEYQSRSIFSRFRDSVCRLASPLL